MGGVELVIPFLVADAILGWMVWHSWRRREMWMMHRMARKDEDRAVYWMSLARLAALLALSLVGTIAAWHAA